MSKLSVLEAKGYVWRHTESDYDNNKYLNLTKSRLGNFFYWARKFGCTIGDTFYMTKHDRSYVGVSIAIKPENIKEFEEKAKVLLKKPPTIERLIL